MCDIIRSFLSPCQTLLPRTEMNLFRFKTLTSKSSRCSNIRADTKQKWRKSRTHSISDISDVSSHASTYYIIHNLVIHDGERTVEFSNLDYVLILLSMSQAGWRPPAHFYRRIYSILGAIFHPQFNVAWPGPGSENENAMPPTHARLWIFIGKSINSRMADKKRYAKIVRFCEW